ncbi:MAG: DUF433 domain-containing protein [Aggregatilineales bacterium]
MQAGIVIKDYVMFKDDEARIVDKEHLKAEVVARMYVNGKASIEEVMAQYGLSRAQVHAALAYYFENQAVLDALYEKSWAESKGIKSAEFKKQILSRS